MFFLVGNGQLCAFPRLFGDFERYGDVTSMMPKERFTDSLHVAFDAGRRVK